MLRSVFAAAGGKLTLRTFTVLVLALLVVGAPALAIPSLTSDDNAPPLPALVPAGPAAVSGQWEAPFEGQIPAIHMALLPNGKVLYWSGDLAGDHDNIYFLSTVDGSESRILDPALGAAGVTKPSDPNGQTPNLFCSGHTILPDGRILSAGGSLWHATVAEQDTSFVDGVPDSRIYDWRTDAWTKASDMEVARWYPTVMTISHDRALVASGILHLPDPTTHQSSMETFDGSSWNFVNGGNNTLPLYPRLYELPSGPLKGQLYYAVGGTLWGPFGEHPMEALWNLAQVYDPATHAWRMLGPNVFGARQSPDDVLLPLDPLDGYHAKLLTFAGTLQRSVVATNTAEMTDFATDPPTHAVAAPLHTPRWQSTGVLLPDGKVLAVGGALYDNVMTFGTPDPAVMTGEIYDPAKDAWTETPPMTIPREYHGTALLLPDARVLVGGHVPNPVPWKAMRDNIPMANQSPQTKFEIYEPPYLHYGVARPVLQSWPSTLGYNATFTVTVDDASKVHDAIMVRNGAETHSNDPGMRGVILHEVSRSGNEITFQSPLDDVVATAGPWMLFLRNGSPQGLVPSVAQIVMLGGA